MTEDASIHVSIAVDQDVCIRNYTRRVIQKSLHAPTRKLFLCRDEQINVPTDFWIQSAQNLREHADSDHATAVVMRTATEDSTAVDVTGPRAVRPAAGITGRDGVHVRFQKQ